MDEEITLILPAEVIRPGSDDYEEWERKILDYRREFLENGDTMNGSRGLHHYEKISGWLKQIKACEKDGNSYIGVPVTTFLAIRRDSSGEQTIVGNIEIRHHLNPALEELGGHIGCCVRPSMRRRPFQRHPVRISGTQYRKQSILDFFVIMCYTVTGACPRLIRHALALIYRRLLPETEQLQRLPFSRRACRQIKQTEDDPT